MSKIKLHKNEKVFLIVLFFILAVALIISQNADPNFGPLYSLKRVQEKVFLSLRITPKDKLEYMSYLLDKRLKELEDPIKNNDHNYVLESSSRYFTLAGQMTDLIVANNLKDYVNPIQQKFSNQQKELYDLYVYYPKSNKEDEEWKYILDDINYLKLYIDRLSQVK